MVLEHGGEHDSQWAEGPRKVRWAVAGRGKRGGARV
jgi:hypothetical protein